MSKPNLVIFQVSKEEIKENDLRTFKSLVDRLRLHKEKAAQSLAIMFDGYNADFCKLYNIEEVRLHTHKILEACPELFYYLNRELDADKIIASNLGNVKPLKEGSVFMTMDSKLADKYIQDTLAYAERVNDKHEGDRAVSLLRQLKGD